MAKTSLAEAISPYVRVIANYMTFAEAALDNNDRWLKPTRM
jgi:hypothetical protein